MFDPSSFPEPTLLSVNGVELEVFEAGTQNAGNPIVLCHGFPEHAFSWRHQVPALVAAGYHVIVPNQRGFGNSSRPSEVTDYDIAHLCGDLVALLDHFGYAQATFMGHDWGASTVYMATGLAPERVEKLVTIAIPPARAVTPGPKLFWTLRHFWYYALLGATVLLVVGFHQPEDEALSA